MSIYNKDLTGSSRYDRAIMRMRELCTGKRVLCNECALKNTRGLESRGTAHELLQRV